MSIELAGGYGDAVVTYIVRRRPGLDQPGIRSAPTLMEGDTVTVRFDNRYDSRFADRSVVTGEVVQHDPYTRDTTVVVLTIEADDRRVHVNSHGAVGVSIGDGPHRYKPVGLLESATTGTASEGE